MPEKWHGLSDVETRYRRRYVDLIVNPHVKEVFLTRSRLISAVRSFFIERGFVEVDTPMLHQVVGGAAARPFVTHHNTLDMDLFLRIAPELYLKRLVVGGMDKVFEINKNFRNEGISTHHNPEFTMLEFYEAYKTYEDLMALTEQLFCSVAEKVLGTTTLTYQGARIELAPPWERIELARGGRQIRRDRPGRDHGRVADARPTQKAGRGAGEVLGVGKAAAGAFRKERPRTSSRARSSS